ncbi:MAG: bifunctional oligoribonuclease/PAP phosphatase NrnA [Chloroflexota bacterium]|nr:bifunctional oligoribonuclease/PAP phosphatase NrnA [Chloroflexota bacterium]
MKSKIEYHTCARLHPIRHGRSDAGIREASCVLVCSHLRPDGDAIGSLLAMGWALEQLGKAHTLACPHPVPSQFHFLPGWEQITQKLEPGCEYDLVIALDSGDMDRFAGLRDEIESLEVPILVIDHHVTNAHFGMINWVKPEAVATAEILFSLLPRLGLQLDETVATYLLTGIVTDTQGFRTSNTSPRTMEIVRDLLRAGASLAAISDQTLNRRSLSALRLWAAVLPSVECRDHLVWGEIPLSVRRASGYAGGDDADLVQFLATVDEAEVAAIFYELEDGRVRLSLRSRPGTDVSKAAQQLGGGGHAQAAGATLEGPLKAARRRVLDLLLSPAY